MDILIFVFALSVLVLVHEFGHYIAAIKTGVKVEEFGLGLPPRIIGKKIGKTIFSLNWLPIGGFCKLYGEDGDKNGGEAFNNKKPWQKALIVVGGVTMNLILAIVIFAIVYAKIGIPQKLDRVKVSGIAKNSPAEVVGIKENDIILSVGGEDVFNPEQLTLEVGEEKKYNVIVRENPPEGEGMIGVVITNIVMEDIKWYELHKSISAGFREAIYWGKMILGGLGQMMAGIFSGHAPTDVAGPIGMYKMTSQVRQNDGLFGLLQFFGIISVNLAVVNILPFPALDGGRLIFVLYEFIFRKRPNQKFEVVVNNIGMIVLLSLILLVTVGDVIKLVK